MGVGGGGSFQMMGETKFSSFALGKLPALSRIKDELEQNHEKGSSLRTCGAASFCQMRTSGFLS